MSEPLENFTLHEPQSVYATSAPITDIAMLDPDGTYTVSDYLSWQFDELVQLVKGKIVRMSPAPLLKHQTVVLNIATALKMMLQPSKGGCRPFVSPIDVYLFGMEGKKPTVVQPDVCVVCDPSQLSERACIGPPTLVCEVVSKGSLKMDTVTKLALYEEAGVPEYWLVFPGEQTILQYVLKDSKYGTPTSYDQDGVVLQSAAIPAISLVVEEAFVLG